MYDVRSERLELVIKYPKGDKPPYIGVLFANDRLKQAAALNQDWVDDFKDHFFAITFEIRERNLHLTLSLDDFKMRHTYVVQVYDQIRLKQFLQIAGTLDKINFGHVVKGEDEKHVPVKTKDSRVYWVVKVKSVGFGE